MKAHNYLYIPLVLFSIFAFSSCSEDISSPAPAEILSLKEGNRWIYSISQYDSVHTLRWTMLDTIEIGAPSIHYGKTWYPYVDITFRLNTLDDTLFYRNESDGLWAIVYFRLLDSKPYLAYKYPAVTSDTFATTLSYSDDSSTLYKRYNQVAGSQYVISVPAGTFSCIRYDSHYQSLNPVNMNILQDTVYAQDYVAPGIGLIKSVGYNQEQVLVSYTF